MKKPDTIVVGSGISGMTMALFLGLNGYKVILLEKALRIGGSVARFHRGGIPFDVGFHFTGGLQEGGTLHNMLTALGLMDGINPIFLFEDGAFRFVFEDEGKSYTIPYGFDKLKTAIKGYFPGEAEAVERHFSAIRNICDKTPAMNLNTISLMPPNVGEDYISLDDALKRLTSNPLLRGLLSGYAMCYGVKPSEISFASHARMCMGFYESLAYIKDRGDTLVRVFKKRFEDIDIEIRCGKHIVELADIKDNRVNRFVLNTGEELEAENCVFTIHPHEILKILPL
ncbi:MAG: NAD(P)/FAD-dependent oxidoreductase [Nitrospirae bacterium]|nr:NAD(P)/FAD-dependent oxidoreductase [Nitrospirota bacterium]